jgi:hypothetical protein
MAKPILVVTIPQTPTQEYLQGFSQDVTQRIANEYHVLVIVGDVTKVEVFYEKDFNQVKYEELKAIIEKEVLNATNKV